MKFKKPASWMTINDAREYVQEKFGRHWSRPYVYMLMEKGRLEFTRFGATRITTKAEIMKTVKGFRKKGIPPVMKKV